MFILFLLFIVSPFLLLAPSSSPCQPRLPAPRPPTAFPGPLSLSPLALRPDRGGGPNRTAHQSERPELPLPPASPAQRRCSPIALRARLAGPPNRGRAGPPAPRPSRARRRLGGGRAGPRHSRSGAAQRRARAAALGAQAAALLLAGCWAVAAGEAGATGRPERRLSSTGARGAGPRTEEEAAPPLPGAGPGARPEGPRPDVPGPERPGRASWRGPPELPAAPWGASASPDSPAPAARHPGAGACAPRGHLPRSPAGRGRRRGRPRPHRSARRPQSHRSACRARPRGVSSPGTAARDAARQRGCSRGARRPCPCLLGHAPLFTCR